MQFEEGGRATAIQIAIPFFAAGLGMVAAGVLLHHVLVSLPRVSIEHWKLEDNKVELTNKLTSISYKKKS